MQTGLTRKSKHIYFLMNDQSEADYNKYEETETAEIKKVIEEIRKLLV